MSRGGQGRLPVLEMEELSGNCEAHHRLLDISDDDGPPPADEPAESMDYLPPHSRAYTLYLARQPRRLEWDRWLMMGLIGFAVGLTGFLLHQLIDTLIHVRWLQARSLIQGGEFVKAWGSALGISLAMLVPASALVVWVYPAAGGSGLPEVIGFLNGTLIRHIFNIRTLVVKFLSCVLAISSGLFAGPEGPMIHIGALIGAGLSQFKSDSLRIRPPYFARFRNSADRRNFISAGAGAGIASAFGSPVGGLLFSIEEMASFWNMRLSWQIFFCCMVATFTTDLFNSAFVRFSYAGQFGLFKADRSIIFRVTETLNMHILAFIPTVLLGVTGGLLGALFVCANLRLGRLRAWALSRVPGAEIRKVLRLAEAVLILLVTVSVTVYLPALFPCSPVTCHIAGDVENSPLCLNHTPSVSRVEPDGAMKTLDWTRTELDVELFTCRPGYTEVGADGVRRSNRTFNQVATLLWQNGERAIKHLFSRRTHQEFGVAALLTVLPVYFSLACWCAGSAIASGLVVPTLYVGALYGRLLGVLLVSLVSVVSGGGVVSDDWAWIDPGAFALIGAASFFAGVSRLTMSLTVIMVEITNDVEFLLPIMLAVMVAKAVGDRFTPPLYHALLAQKKTPYLDSEPCVVFNNRVVNLELLTAGDAMSEGARVLGVRESAGAIARLLLRAPHGAYPVVRPPLGPTRSSDGGDEQVDEEAGGSHKPVFCGTITRLELLMILSQEILLETEETQEHEPTVVLDYQMINGDKITNPPAIRAMLLKYAQDAAYNQRYINLSPYVNESAVSVPLAFSLHRAYILFRTLGLRHLVVLDRRSRPVGLLTRKDLVASALGRKLKPILLARSAPAASGANGGRAQRRGETWRDRRRWWWRRKRSSGDLIGRAGDL